MPLFPLLGNAVILIPTSGGQICRIRDSTQLLDKPNQAGTRVFFLLQLVEQCLKFGCIPRILPVTLSELGCS